VGDHVRQEAPRRRARSRGRSAGERRGPAGSPRSTATPGRVSGSLPTENRHDSPSRASTVTPGAGTAGPASPDRPGALRRPRIARRPRPADRAGAEGPPRRLGDDALESLRPKAVPARSKASVTRPCRGRACRQARGARSTQGTRRLRRAEERPPSRTSTFVSPPSRRRSGRS
jgi:hypothetical protein